MCMQISLQIHIPGCLVNIDIQKDVSTGYTYIHTDVLYCVYILIYINENKGAWCLYI